MLISDELTDVFFGRGGGAMLPSRRDRQWEKAYKGQIFAKSAIFQLNKTQVDISKTYIVSKQHLRQSIVQPILIEWHVVSVS